jgi:hypothetical protein
MIPLRHKKFERVPKKPNRSASDRRSDPSSADGSLLIAVQCDFFNLAELSFLQLEYDAFF